MNHKYLTELIDYHSWAQDRVFRAVECLSPEQFTRDMGNSFGSVRDTLAHIHAAECVWYRRWVGSGGALPSAGTFPDLESLRSASEESEARIRELLVSLGQDGVHGVIDYTDRDGESRSDVFWRIFQHVMNHATYHRGQVTTLLRQLGAKPPEATDLIRFYWERVP